MELAGRGARCGNSPYADRRLSALGSLAAFPRQDPMDSSRVIESPLPDLADIDLVDLRCRDDSVLWSALQRIREQALQGEQVVAGFNSAI